MTILRSRELQRILVGILQEEHREPPVVPEIDRVEERDRRHDRGGDRDHDPEHDEDVVGAVDSRRFLQGFRDGEEIVLHEDEKERVDGQRDDHHQVAVDEPEVQHHQVEGDEPAGEEHGDDDVREDGVAPRQALLGQRVGGRGGDQHTHRGADDGDHGADQECARYRVVREDQRVGCQVDMLGNEVEGAAGHVLVTGERDHQHVVEGHDREHQDQQEHAVNDGVGHPVADAARPGIFPSSLPVRTGKGLAIDAEQSVRHVPRSPRTVPVGRAAWLPSWRRAAARS